MAPCLHFLRPYAFQPLAPGSPSGCSAYLRFYDLARQRSRVACQRNKSTKSKPSELGGDDYNPENRSALMAFRIKELKQANALSYPRLKKYAEPMTISRFRSEYEWKVKDTSQSHKEIVTLGGRVRSISRLGSKLFFLRIVMDGTMVQAVLNISKLVDGTDLDQFMQLSRLLQRGDHISITGRPVRTKAGELSIEAIHLPQLVSPGLVPLPQTLPEEARMNQRHIDLLVNRPAEHTLRVRSYMTTHLRQYLENSLGCIEVQTPILAANAGGAMARPFATTATEFPDKQLALRIAPELWLKRLVVAGFDRVYEIGPAFRNEGIDSTHNPEFTMCEFYLSHFNLDQVMGETRKLFLSLAKGVAKFKEKFNISLEHPDPKLFEGEWEVVDFIPALNKALGHQLPDLESPDAVESIIKILEEKHKTWHKSLPPNPSLAKLLDHMAGAVLEPQSQGKPVFIIKHPVCMSPLAKSYTCPITNQVVSARAEVFFDGNELANMYEEENDPFVQRHKFVKQAKLKTLAQQQQTTSQGEQAAEDEEPPHVIDHQYISVLQSGLPPTGGWGCGVDRLVMMFTGAKRISDVLPFGTLKNVVGLASTGPQKQQAKKVADVEEDPRVGVETPAVVSEQITPVETTETVDPLEAKEDEPKTETPVVVSEQIISDVTTETTDPSEAPAVVNEQLISDETTEVNSPSEAKGEEASLSTTDTPKDNETQSPPEPKVQGAADDALRYAMGMDKTGETETSTADRLRQWLRSN
ncbi:Lysine--tRNA ligase, mitochondrial [Cytospora mali]|uniref:Lysine--tRNA ligase, mitochondrial n=1 Tax=Cytospora mali TaxID=578113 RepID=A0A194VG54_CYTMA|nr:Lysine--tRNA ligase, mitochondrial [Valsa mali var. pyri (nom. inval.)]